MQERCTDIGTSGGVPAVAVVRQQPPTTTDGAASVLPVRPHPPSRARRPDLGPRPKAAHGISRWNARHRPTPPCIPTKLSSDPGASARHIQPWKCDCRVGIIRKWLVVVCHHRPRQSARPGSWIRNVASSKDHTEEEAYRDIDTREGALEHW